MCVGVCLRTKGKKLASTKDNSTVRMLVSSNREEFVWRDRPSRQLGLVEPVGWLVGSEFQDIVYSIQP